MRRTKWIRLAVTVAVAGLAVAALLPCVVPALTEGGTARDGETPVDWQAVP